MSARPLGEGHQRHVLQGMLAVHSQMADLEALPSHASRPSPFSQYVNDLSPTEVQVLLEHFARIRVAMLAHIEELGIPLAVRRASVRWAIQTTLMHIKVCIDNMGPRELEGYGPLDEAGRAAVVRIQDDLSRLIERTSMYLTDGLGRNLASRLARLEAASVGDRSLTVLERIIARWQLVEFRPTLEMIVTRLESPKYEVAVFGRVSTGKSSLLNHVVGIDMLPVGVTPVTSVPTRLEGGESIGVVVSFAESRPRSIAAQRLWEYASEEGNPGNEKHVTGIHLTVPSHRLHSGVTFVDTPGIGSLAATGAAESLAYLPRCDLGIVLIDAAASLAPDDLVLLRSLYESGAPAMVLLSKADLLSASERERMIGYIRAQIQHELELDLPVYPVSVVGADESLLTRWFESELEPLMKRHQELVTASLYRKISSVRESIASTLEFLLSNHNGGLRDAHIDAGNARRVLDSADKIVRRIREQFQNSSSEREQTLDLILARAAGRVKARGGRSIAVSENPIAATVSEVLDRRARTAHEQVARFRDALGDLLEGLQRSVPMPEADESHFKEMKFEGLPVADFGTVLSGREVLCPWWTMLFPWLAEAAVQRKIWGRFGGQIEELVDTYDRRLQLWAKSTIDVLVERFELQAAISREHVRRLLPAANEAYGTEDVTELEADLRELRQGSEDVAPEIGAVCDPATRELQQR